MSIEPPIDAVERDLIIRGEIASQALSGLAFTYDEMAALFDEVWVEPFIELSEVVP